LKIRLENIPDTGLVLDETRPKSWLTNFTDMLEEGARPGVAGAVGFHLEISRAGEQVRVVGDIRVGVVAECARCLAELHSEVKAPVDVVLVPSRSGGESEDIEDEGFGTYENPEEIDIGEHLRGQLALYFPFRFLCRPDCRGLCDRCGADLNVKECDCRKNEWDSRWDALRKLKM